MHYLRYIRTVDVKDCQVGSLYLAKLNFPITKDFILEEVCLSCLIVCRLNNEFEVLFERKEGVDCFLERNLDGLIFFPLDSGDFYEVTLISIQEDHNLIFNPRYQVKDFLDKIQLKIESITKCED